LVQAKARLEADKEATEEELLDLQRQMNERLSKLMRLCRQKRLLQSKGLKMLQQDLENEGELEVSEAQPGESSSVVDSIAAGAVDLIDWDSVFADAPFVDPSLFSEAAGGSSSGVARH
jgi:3-methyladenine DNA glycosylase AlkC